MASSPGNKPGPKPPARPPGPVVARRLAPAHPEDPYDLDFTGLATDLPPPPPPPVARSAADANLIGALGLDAHSFHVMVTRPHPQHATNGVVLIVEDDAATAARAAKALREAKYKPAVARSPQEATQMMAKLGAPAMLLLNVDLPGVDGITFLERMRKHPQLGETPVVLFTSHSKPDDVIRGLMAGADGYVAKPVTAAALISAVKTVLGE